MSATPRIRVLRDDVNSFDEPDDLPWQVDAYVPDGRGPGFIGPYSNAVENYRTHGDAMRAARTFAARNDLTIDTDTADFFTDWLTP